MTEEYRLQNINDAGALNAERRRLQARWFAAKAAARAAGMDVDASIRSANAAVDESVLFASASDGEPFTVGNGGEWRTSGGMSVFVEHPTTRYVRLTSGEVRYAR